jgi:hypothetical protein
MPVPGLTGFMPQTAVPAGPQVYINPASRFDNHAGGPFYAEGNFTLVSNVGVPTAYVWSIIAGTGTVQAGQGTATPPSARPAPASSAARRPSAAAITTRKHPSPTSLAKSTPEMAAAGMAAAADWRCSSEPL